MKKSLLFCAACAMAASVYAQDFAAGQYCIREVSTGMYLNSGWSWGTHGVLKPQARVFELTPAGGDAYQIKSSLGYVKFDGEVYLDGGESVCTLTKSGDYYTISYNGNYFMMDANMVYVEENYNTNGMEPGQYPVNLTQDAAAASKFEIISREDMIKNLDAATAENPLDATFLFKAHNIAINDPDNNSAWTYTKGGVSADLIYPDSGWGHNFGDWHNKATYAWCINDEAADGEDVVSQEAADFPAGKYSVEYLVVNQPNTTLTVKFNDTDAEPIQFGDNSDLWYGSAANLLADNSKTTDFTVGKDGKLTVKMVKETKAGEQNRFAFKAFRFSYLGNPEGAGVDDVVMDNENAPVEYYNLQGVRVANPANGLYIKKQGNKVSKVVIR